jgi:hypothetical protein
MVVVVVATLFIVVVVVEVRSSVDVVVAFVAVVISPAPDHTGESVPNRATKSAGKYPGPRETQSRRELTSNYAVSTGSPCQHFATPLRATTHL